MGWDGSYWRPPSKPRPVKGGIKAQSKRGAFGTKWWAKRWIAVLEGLGMGARLTRGRSYARNGQVTGITIERGVVRAKVQGSRKTPYTASIAVAHLTAAEWRKVAESIAATPRFAAMLLNGEMPEDIESAFTAAECRLFPKSRRDLHTACSCPDSSNPCKHLAAVYYLIGEEFDRDPFLLFALRGLERDALVALVTAAEPASPATSPRKPAPRTKATGTEKPVASVEEFWNGKPVERPAGAESPVEPAPVNAWLLRSAGRFPFWHGSITLEEALLVVYAKAGEDAMARLAGTPRDDSEG